MSLQMAGREEATKVPSNLFVTIHIFKHKRVHGIYMYFYYDIVGMSNTFITIK